MNIEEKYNIKYLRKLFTQLFKHFNKDHRLTDGEEDPTLFDDVEHQLREIYGYKDQDEIDYLYAAFIKNYYTTGGDFDQLGESVKPFTPQLVTFEIEEEEYCDVRITNYYTIKTYNKALAKSFLYNGLLVADDYDQDILECHDREVEIEEVPTKEETIEEDLEYWKTNTKGPEDEEYNMGPSE